MTSELNELRHQIEAANSALSNLGRVNPRRPGLHNDAIQLVKRLIGRTLSWYTRSLRECLVPVLASLNEAERQLESLNVAVLASSNETRRGEDTRSRSTATLSPTPFTAHNIRLDDGTETFPSEGVTMDRYFVMQAAQRVLRIVFPEGLEGKTVIDVGCLEGGYTVEFARMGMNALGLEPRSSNYANCLYVKDRVNLPHLRFVQGDANDIDQFGEFDVFFVSGLLYHLDRPKAFLEKVAQNCRRLLILNTHVSHCRPTVGMRRHHLSDMAENEGLQGRWQVEYTATSLEEIDTFKWASWSNPRSFWIQKEHLLGLIKSIGFSLVFEQFDQFSDITYETTSGYYSTEDRVQIIGIKTP